MGCSDKRRFELELEFLHCLANPGYLNCEPLAACCWVLQGERAAAAAMQRHPAKTAVQRAPSVYLPPAATRASTGLAQNRYFEDDAFLQYLQYLQYWQQPGYARFVV